MSHNWTTEPLRFNPDRINDRELWTDIRDTFRQDVQKPWKRLFGFKKVKSIVPIGVCLSHWSCPLKLLGAVRELLQRHG